MSLRDFSFSKEKNTIIKKYIVPKRIVTSLKSLNTEWLLKDTARQAVLCNYDENCIIEKGGYVVLDFGSELQGGIDITINKVEAENQDAGQYSNYGKVRIVFGESVSEALSKIGDGSGAQNEHSTRDMTVNVSCRSTMRFGNTGFRFVKIEATDCSIFTGCVKGVLEYKDLEYKGSFLCNDERLNKIFDVAAYTVHLNMQDYVWDGIKRDRLVWIGDLNPELATICSVFGYDECVEKSMDLAKETYPVNSKSGEIEWMAFPSYSCWWIINHRDWYMQNGRVDYLLKQKDYMYKLADNLIKRIAENGQLDFNEDYFVEWSSCKEECLRYREAGFRGCLILALEAAAQIFKVYKDFDMSDKCLFAAECVKKIVPEFSGNKQMCAMAAISELCDIKAAEKVITKDLLSGLSTFYGYYILEALAKADNIQAAIEIIRGYWGAMIDYGATTFWEDFDIKWIENAGRIDEIANGEKADLHKDFGNFCYKKLRHSLCHGWASGPVPFMQKNILGVNVLEPGCTKVRILPRLGDLEWVKGTYPTPYGVIKIEHRKVNGKIESKISAPKEVEII